MPTMEYDFESLPPVVRRKCFSTLERLRLAHSPDTTSRAGFGPRKSGSGKARSKTPKPVLNRKAASSNCPICRRLRKPKSDKGPGIVSPADAQWYLRLPDKVQKKHFSREEQAALAGRRRSLIFDIADKALYDFGRDNNHSEPNATTSLASTSSIRPCAFDSQVTVAATSDMDETMGNTFRWLDDEEDLDLKLDDYHAHLTETVVAASPPKARKPTFRRGSSSNSIPVGRVSTSSIKLPISQVPTPLPSPSLQTSHQRTRSRPHSGQFRWSRRPSIPRIDPEAIHYRDPEARLKLRVYLASPQKFDEAIEFGFPSLECGEKSNRRRAKSSGNGGRGNDHNASTHTFFDDDAGSLWEADGGDADDASLPDIDAPKTPSDAVFKPTHRLPNLSKSSLTDPIGLARPRSKPRTSDASARVLPGNREMTLRMTLTRPDLRDDETALYDWYDGPEKDDPLALEDLPLGPDGTAGVMGPFGGSDGWGPSKDDGVMKRMWKRVSRRT